ncbi:MAG: penicillin-binding protein 1C [Saprospiraceae bacterium]|nr:penicillin-binding protein 1C [Saprospiraceae bacterium]
MPKPRFRNIFFLFILLSALFLGIGIISLPSPNQPWSKVLFASDGQLLNARIAKDEQWRFEQKQDLPSNYIVALTCFEDQYFFKHPGVNPFSLWRAVVQNYKAGKIISGGSTLTMQDIRLRRGSRKRNLVNKLLEMYWGITLELLHSKYWILKDYAGRAPFGSNVVGLEAACWRYFDKPLSRLSWAEAACLAVLPNSPGLMHPGKNRSSLEQKRNNLLKKLLSLQRIDSVSYRLALLEPVPEAPRPLINLAPHALDYLSKTQGKESYFRSTIQYDIQKMVIESAYWAHESLNNAQIQNLAILIASTESGEVLAYCGNAPNTAMSPYVDHAQAPRSTGSILKPFLLTGALNQGYVLPTALMDDIPVVIDGFQPQNFSKRYTGMTALDQSLIQSLNIPFVHLLKIYGLEHFHFDLQRLGLHHIDKAPSYYGLTLILGGAESSLWDLAGAYAFMGRTLLHYTTYDHQYFKSDRRALNLIKEEKQLGDPEQEPSLFHAVNIYSTLNILKNLKRPDESGQWNSFTSLQDVAWKTGTSYGFRDAWAIGINPEYTVAVWAGNSDGEGKPGLLGIRAAAPILFDLFSRLPRKNPTWFSPPFNEMIRIPICVKSGMKPSRVCPLTDTIWSSRFEDQSGICPFHLEIWVNALTEQRVNQSCFSEVRPLSKTIFVLPPVQAYYYSINQPEYEPLPEWDPACITHPDAQVMKMIYPQNNSTILIPMDRDGQPGKIIFKLAHRTPETKIYWHLDADFLGSTQQFHEYSVNTFPGPHTLTLLDEKGNELVHHFEVLSR